MKKNMYKLNIVVALMLLFMASIAFGKVAKADQGMSFSVSAVIPENQINKEQSYFDLKMTPGQEQELEVIMRNATDEDIVVRPQINTAITNDNGVIDYSWNIEDALKQAEENNKNEKKEKIDTKTIAYDSTLKTPVSEIITGEKEVTIPKQSSLSYKMKVKMPEESFDGVLLGGIYFTQKEDENVQDKNKSGVQIENKFAYVIGIKLSETETKIEPDMALDKNKIKAASLNGYNAVTINLQNTTPVMLRDLSVDAKIYAKGNSNVLHETQKDGLKMAPNSNFNYAVDWQNQLLKPGKYVAKVVAENKASTDETEEMNQKWEWEEEFTITGEEAKKLNNKAVELIEEPTPWWIYLLIGLGILLLILIILYLIKRHIDKKKEEERIRQAKAKARKRKKANLAKKKRASESGAPKPQKKRPNKDQTND